MGANLPLCSRGLRESSLKGLVYDGCKMARRGF